MNFEELLETRDERKTTKVRLPYGYFYKRQIDGKYSNFVEFHDELADSIAFGGCVKAEHQALSEIRLKQQLHYTPNEGEDGIFAIAVEPGNYITFEQLLNDNPAIVAKSDFLSLILGELFDIASELNAHDIYHVCFAPSNILVRKNDSSVRLLCHGSFYQKIDADTLYEGVEDYVAPELFAGDVADARCDVYSLGMFIKKLYESSAIPFRLRRAVEKATAADPTQRYGSIDEMRKDIRKTQNLQRTGLLAAAAAAIALCIAGIFFYMLPDTQPVEFVKPVEEPIPDDLFEDNMDDYLGIGKEMDSATIAKIVAGERLNKDSMSADEKKLREYNAKAEAIFRKQFTKAAETIISEVYNYKSMNGEQAVFAAKSKDMTEKLAKKQMELTKASSLSAERTQVIAAEIVEHITKQKMESLDKDYLGIKGSKGQQENENATSNPVMTGNTSGQKAGTSGTDYLGIRGVNANAGSGSSARRTTATGSGTAQSKDASGKKGFDYKSEIKRDEDEDLLKSMSGKK